MTHRAITTTAIVTALLTATANAQTGDHTETIRVAKAAAIAQGQNPDADECARFDVVNRAANMLVAEGAGVLYKPTGNNCRERAVDIIAYPNGRIFDVLGAGPEGPNTPHWMELTPVDPGRWRPAFSLAPSEPPTPPVEPPQPTPTPVPSNDHAVLLAAVQALQTELAAHVEAEESHWEKAKTSFYSVIKYLGPIIGGIVAGKTVIR